MSASAWSVINWNNSSPWCRYSTKHLYRIKRSMPLCGTNLCSLGTNSNLKITSANHLAHLETLNDSGNYGIGDAGIAQCTRLRSLIACSNPKITSVNHLVHLEMLDAGYGCGIADAGIAQCTSLRLLDAFENPKITKKLAI